MTDHESSTFDTLIEGIMDRLDNRHEIVPEVKTVELKATGKSGNSEEFSFTVEYTGDEPTREEKASALMAEMKRRGLVDEETITSPQQAAPAIPNTAGSHAAPRQALQAQPAPDRTDSSPKQDHPEKAPSLHKYRKVMGNIAVASALIAVSGLGVAIYQNREVDIVAEGLSCDDQAGSINAEGVVSINVPVELTDEATQQIEEATKLSPRVYNSDGEQPTYYMGDKGDDKPENDDKLIIFNVCADDGTVIGTEDGNIVTIDRSAFNVQTTFGKSEDTDPYLGEPVKASKTAYDALEMPAISADEAQRVNGLTNDENYYRERITDVGRYGVLQKLETSSQGVLSDVLDDDTELIAQSLSDGDEEYVYTGDYKLAESYRTSHIEQNGEFPEDVLVSENPAPQISISLEEQDA